MEVAAAILGRRIVMDWNDLTSMVIKSAIISIFINQVLILDTLSSVKSNGLFFEQHGQMLAAKLRDINILIDQVQLNRIIQENFVDDLNLYNDLDFEVFTEFEI